jgi:polyisoprenoid-binding protein YceI
MKPALISLLVALSGLLAPLAAQQPIPSGSVTAGTLSFDGHGSGGDFVGTTGTIIGEMRGADDLSGVRGWVEAPVRTLKTGNGRRDKDLNKSMESDKYPTIRFDLSGVTEQERRGDTVTVALKGTFTIHGVTREATLPATVALLPNAVHLRADTPLNLKDYKIGGLKKLFGILKMDEHIQVHVDLSFASTTLSSR